MEKNKNMYCKHCGKVNPEGSRYCQHCGKDIGISAKTDQSTYTNTHTEVNHVDQNTSPYPYVISIPKLIVMSFVTIGIYDIYWFYRQWKSFNAENKLKYGNFTLWIYALFAPLSSYSLFKHVSAHVKGINNGKGLEAGGLAVLYFFLNRIWLGFLPLIPAQNKINLYWEHKYKDKLVRSHFGIWNWIVVIAVILIAMSTLSSETSTTTSDVTNAPEEATAVSNKTQQEEIASSVVNIFCPSSVSGISPSGGSGTIITEEGIILTNSHIIPQYKDKLSVDEQGCIVVLPDPVTGQPAEIYLANPVVIPGISDNYDLAYLKIYDAYYDEEDKEYKGTYPTTFPAFDDSERCKSEDVRLGEAVTIYGYPAISGGYSLTVTDGVVSSFPGEDLIVTSAKISSGNSGGLAVDKDGCMIGIPSQVSSDENESLGVIYSVDLIRKFSSEVMDLLEEK